jgi:hypothetical protein
MAGKWKRLHNEKLHSSYISSNITRIVKSRKMRWVGHVARLEKREIHTMFWVEDLKGRDYSESLAVDGRAILKLVLGK